MSSSPAARRAERPRRGLAARLVVGLLGATLLVPLLAPADADAQEGPDSHAFTEDRDRSDEAEARASGEEDRAEDEAQRELSGLWLPTHLLQDAESDDTLSWLLLERVRRLLGAGPLRVMLQLGAEEKLDKVAAHMASKGAVVWRDAGSKNGDAVLKNHAHI